MKFTEDVVASLRAFLRVDIAEYDRSGELLTPPEREARGALLVAAFVVASEKRFGHAGTSEIVDFVARLRSRTEEMADLIDPRTAERLISAAATEGSVDDISTYEKGTHYGPLLAAMVVEESLTDDELDDFLSESLELAKGLPEAG
ncbi:hypothetical protein [Microlunatus sp. GCM10028923]|uniref:hypothetical protein n=1 Tax=Microlunatus sp. GCM10028923 TaxID=3273400 RepID=UPI00360F2492